LIRLRLMFRSSKVFKCLTIKWFLLRIIRLNIKCRLKTSRKLESIIRTHCLRVMVLLIRNSLRSSKTMKILSRISNQTIFPK
jgi:hypothetical protein